MDPNSPEYAAWYWRLSPSTRMYARAPGSADAARVAADAGNSTNGFAEAAPTLPPAWDGSGVPNLHTQATPPPWVPQTFNPLHRAPPNVNVRTPINYDPNGPDASLIRNQTGNQLWRDPVNVLNNQLNRQPPAPGVPAAPNDPNTNSLTRQPNDPNGLLRYGNPNGTFQTDPGSLGGGGVNSLNRVKSDTGQGTYDNQAYGLNGLSRSMGNQRNKRSPFSLGTFARRTPQGYQGY